MVLRVGSFAAAGRQLGYTGSAVSQQMGALESNSGLVLFERGAHGIRPTPAAQLLSERASETLGAFATLEAAVREIATGTRGRLGMGSFPTASEVLVPGALARFARSFRNVEVRFDDGEPEHLLPRLVEGDLDVVVVYRYDLVPQNWPASCQRTPLIVEEVRLLVPETYRPDPVGRSGRLRGGVVDLHPGGQRRHLGGGAGLRECRVRPTDPLPHQRLRRGPQLRARGAGGRGGAAAGLCRPTRPAGGRRRGSFGAPPRRCADRRGAAEPGGDGDAGGVEGVGRRAA